MVKEICLKNLFEAADQDELGNQTDEAGNQAELCNQAAVGNLVPLCTVELRVPLQA